MEDFLGYVWRHITQIAAMIVTVAVPAYQIREKRKEAKALTQAKQAKIVTDTLLSIDKRLEDQVAAQNTRNAQVDERFINIKDSITHLDKAVDSLDKKMDTNFTVVHQRIDKLEGRN